MHSVLQQVFLFRSNTVYKQAQQSVTQLVWLLQVFSEAEAQAATRVPQGSNRGPSHALRNRVATSDEGMGSQSAAASGVQVAAANPRRASRVQPHQVSLGGLCAVAAYISRQLYTLQHTCLAHLVIYCRTPAALQCSNLAIPF